MTEQQTPEFFRAQLNALFRDSGPGLTNRVVVRGMLELGCRISAPYLSQLRTGARTAPSAPVVRALADYFMVSVDFFFDPAYNPNLDNVAPFDLHLIEGLSDAALRRILHSAVGLSSSSYTLIIRLAEQLRMAEGLPTARFDS
ncbi:helix-turn-helix transcriptional regulator [Rhodococcus erythropolis]|uniref:helix-turn-helix domain-containing protein n=1 Tax=Rhodococcus erythropolis TaxID=1833 RepID=UPI001E47D3A1|nr:MULTISPECIES: helix-turn-helix transcriptional regulator [Rhodococcus erythropolis group]MCD2109422.1 helix-turn-helix domain-containing protein [Rhodococcus qingshengii]MCZ4527413.1 helix-turn-helix transcriptional regulator [Rhodococcus erythropolis]